MTIMVKGSILIFLIIITGIWCYNSTVSDILIQNSIDYLTMKLSFRFKYCLVLNFELNVNVRDHFQIDLTFEGKYSIRLVYFFLIQLQNFPLVLYIYKIQNYNPKKS